MRQTERGSGKSTALSWFFVLLLAVAIYAIIRGIASYWANSATAEPDRLPEWLLWIYGVDDWGMRLPWRQPVMIAVILIGLLSIGTALLIARKWSHHGQEAETRALVIGSCTLFLPTLFGSLPALFGLVAMMVTPFISAGLVPVAAQFLPPDMADWVCKGTLGSWNGYEELHSSLTDVAQPIVAFGLAISVVGFIQVFRAYKEKRLQTQGLYATVRHPQHLGIALWSFGLALAVSSTAGYMMCFTVIYFYGLLALREERLLSERFGTVYDSYRTSTPFVIPFINIGLPLPGSGAPRVAALVAYYAGGMALLCTIMEAIGVTVFNFV